MSTIYQPVPKEVEAVSDKLNEFVLWHEKYHYELSELHLSEKEGHAYLDDILLSASIEYHSMIDELGEAMKHYSPEQKKYAFSYLLEKGLAKLLKDSPYWYHSIFKPRGYAGDAEMMALIYRDRYEGPTLFAKLMHRIGLDCAACISIRNRKSLLLDTFSTYPEGKVLSLAAGPAQEIDDYLRYNRDLEFLALDHDIQTLIDARNKNAEIPYAIINAFHLIRGHHQYLIPRSRMLPYCQPKKDLKGIRKWLVPFKYRIETLQKESFDLVYSAGLYDYIETFDKRKDKGSIALTRRLFDLVKPGGRMVIGNMSPRMPEGVRWVMEVVCDWYLIYRTKKEVLAFAADLPMEQVADMQVVEEESGLNYFLDIQKK